MEDHKLIEKTVLDYIEGWYEGNKNRMDNALDHRLAKRRIISKDEFWSVSKTDMLKLTEEGNGKIDNPKQGKKEIIILDIFRNLASVKVLSEKYVDYLHLIKLEEKWKIINALWDFI